MCKKYATYTGAGETDGFQYVYVLIAVCASPVPDPPEAIGNRVGCTSTLSRFHSCFKGIQIKSFGLAAGSGGQTQILLRSLSRVCTGPTINMVR